MSWNCARKPRTPAGVTLLASGRSRSGRVRAKAAHPSRLIQNYVGDRPCWLQGAAGRSGGVRTKAAHPSRRIQKYVGDQPCLLQKAAGRMGCALKLRILRIPGGVRTKAAHPLEHRSDSHPTQQSGAAKMCKHLSGQKCTCAYRVQCATVDPPWVIRSPPVGGARGLWKPKASPPTPPCTCWSHRGNPRCARRAWKL